MEGFLWLSRNEQAQAEVTTGNVQKEMRLWRSEKPFDPLPTDLPNRGAPVKSGARKATDYGLIRMDLLAILAALGIC